MNENTFNRTMKIEQTNILPLRWLANFCGYIACKTILPLSDMDEDGNYGIKYKVYNFIYNATWPISYNYGTIYQWLDDLGGAGWDDYDENGHPYWYFTEWQEDPETRDAWRLIKK